jgi:hypothetical protein
VASGTQAVECAQFVLLLGLSLVLVYYILMFGFGEKLRTKEDEKRG